MAVLYLLVGFAEPIVVVVVAVLSGGKPNGATNSSTHPAHPAATLLSAKNLKVLYTPLLFLLCTHLLVLAPPILCCRSRRKAEALVLLCAIIEVTGQMGADQLVTPETPS